MLEEIATYVSSNAYFIGGVLLGSIAIGISAWVWLGLVAVSAVVALFTPETHASVQFLSGIVIGGLVGLVSGFMVPRIRNYLGFESGQKSDVEAVGSYMLI